MKKYIFILFSFLLINKLHAQNLYLIFDANEPSVTKNVYKYVDNAPSNPRVTECRPFKIGTDGYCFGYPYFYGQRLKLEIRPNTLIQTMTRTQALALYPNAKNATQMDAVMQVHVEYDYLHDLPDPQNPDTSATVSYLRSFTKIFVIEYLPQNQVRIVEVKITNIFL